MLESIQSVLEQNSLHDFMLAVVATVAAVATIYLAQGLMRFRLAPRLKGADSHFAVAMAAVLKATRLWLLLPVALSIGSGFLTLPERVEHAIYLISLIAVILQCALWLNRFAAAWFAYRLLDKRSKGQEGATAFALVMFITRLIVWALALLLILDQLGFNVTALIAGFGIGGVAVALAMQNILSDLFGSLSIVLDKPFVVGDFIVVGELKGTVEYIGLKSARLRSLGGEEIICSNADLLRSRIHNFKRMQERRIVFTVGVVYQTPPEVAEQIPSWLRTAIESESRVRFDRAHLARFGPSSLDFEVVYFVLSAEYNDYMDIQQAVNLTIMRKFSSENVEFAYPSQTLYHTFPSGQSPITREP